MIRLTTASIDLRSAEGHLADPRAGGIVTFVGVVRNHHEGREVVRLEYQAYEDMALEQMRAIARQMIEGWQAYRVALIHRVGVLEIGEAAVFVGVACAHRAAAFEACRHGIEILKAEVPVWKKEVYAGGSDWLANA